MSAELLPCPWCGGLYAKKVGRCIECTSCGASGPEMARNASDAEYIHVWNSRYTPPPQPSVSEGSVPEGFVLVPKEPTPEMLDAGRSAVMARDCSSKKWSPRQHYEASGVSMEGIPDKALVGYHSIIPKVQGAALVYYAMLAIAPQPTTKKG